MIFFYHMTFRVFKQFCSCGSRDCFFSQFISFRLPPRGFFNRLRRCWLRKRWRLYYCCLLNHRLFELIYDFLSDCWKNFFLVNCFMNLNRLFTLFHINFDRIILLDDRARISPCNFFRSYFFHSLFF